MHVWSYAHHTARKGMWREEYLARMRFKRRIELAEELLSPILNERYMRVLIMKIVGYQPSCEQHHFTLTSE